MRLWIYILATLIAFDALEISSANAVVVSPANYSIQFTGVPGAINASGATPQSGAYSFFGGSLDVHAAASTSTLPSVSTTVESGGCTNGGCAGGGYGAIAILDYHIYVSGPAGVLVPYNFDTAGGITSTGLFPFGFSRVALIAPGGTGLAGFDVSTTLNNVNIYCGTNGCVNGTQHVSLRSNTEYTVEVYASAGAGTNFDTSVIAWADPYIYIDPSFVGGDQFSLLISDGIGNAPISFGVPEPATSAILLLGFAGVRFLARRRKNDRAET